MAAEQLTDVRAGRGAPLPRPRVPPAGLGPAPPHRAANPEDDGGARQRQQGRGGSSRVQGSLLSALNLKMQSQTDYFSSYFSALYSVYVWG